MKTRDVRSVVYLAAGVGLLVSLFAAAEFFDASLRGICTINGFFSCALIDQSGKTTTFGIQDYLWGVAGFVAIFVFGGLAERWREDVRPAYALLALTSAGVGLSLYFLYVELVLIGGLCIVCVVAYFWGFVAWAAAVVLARRTARRRRDEGPADTPDPEASTPRRGAPVDET